MSTIVSKKGDSHLITSWRKKMDWNWRGRLSGATETGCCKGGDDQRAGCSLQITFTWTSRDLRSSWYSLKVYWGVGHEWDTCSDSQSATFIFSFSLSTSHVQPEVGIRFAVSPWRGTDRIVTEGHKSSGWPNALWMLVGPSVVWNWENSLNARETSVVWTAEFSPHGSVVVRQWHRQMISKCWWGQQLFTLRIVLWMLGCYQLLGVQSVLWGHQMIAMQNVLWM